MRSFTAIRNDAGLSCGSFLRKGEVFAHARLSQNLKDLKAAHALNNRTPKMNLVTGNTLHKTQNTKHETQNLKPNDPKPKPKQTV